MAPIRFGDHGSLAEINSNEDNLNIQIPQKLASWMVGTRKQVTYFLWQIWRY